MTIYTFVKFWATEKCDISICMYFARQIQWSGKHYLCTSSLVSGRSSMDQEEFLKDDHIFCNVGIFQKRSINNKFWIQLLLVKENPTIWRMIFPWRNQECPLKPKFAIVHFWQCKLWINPLLKIALVLLVTTCFILSNRVWKTN